MSFLRRVLISVLTTSLLTFALPLNAVTWSKHSQTSRRTSEQHADLNHDGREDFVFGAGPGFYVEMSSGGGTYAVPVGYEIPSSNGATSIALGNFASTSGDVAVTDGSATSGSIAIMAAACSAL